MTKMAPRSSTIARAARKILREVGTRLPSSESTPKANAMSVAIGIPQPELVAFEALNKKNIPAGTIIPPKAANMGMAAFFGEESSPSTISRLISKPTNRKKIAINPSLIHNETG